MEWEGIDSFWKIETHTKIHETYDFECIRDRFSIFNRGPFMTHLEKILNPISRDNELDFLNYNVSSINYILNKIVTHLLIERYIKWLEVVQNTEKFKRLHPDILFQCTLRKSRKIPMRILNFIFLMGV